MLRTCHGQSPCRLPHVSASAPDLQSPTSQGTAQHSYWKVRRPPASSDPSATKALAAPSEWGGEVGCRRATKPKRTVWKPGRSLVPRQMSVPQSRGQWKIPGTKQSRTSEDPDPSGRKRDPRRSQLAWRRCRPGNGRGKAEGKRGLADKCGSEAGAALRFLDLLDGCVVVCLCGSHCLGVLFCFFSSLILPIANFII